MPADGLTLFGNGYAAPRRIQIYNEAIGILSRAPSLEDGRGMALDELTGGVRKAYEMRGEPPPTPAAIYQVINHSHRHNGFIVSGGPWRGYRLRQEQAGSDETTMGNTLEAGPLGPVDPSAPPVLLEKHLYPLVASWFHKKHDKATSSFANNKKGGMWQNPDVVAFSVIMDFNQVHIEISTAEVKTSLAGWRQMIFESVAHKIFSERSYFVFRTIDGNFDEDIYEYAEKFRIGIIAVELPEDRVQEIVDWANLSETARLEFLDAITEVVPAPFDPVPVSNKFAFFRRNNMQLIQDLMNLARDPDVVVPD